MAKGSSAALSSVPTKPETKPRASARALGAEKESRIDRMVRLVDQCTAAQGLADELGETFLSYLLAMAIQETRTSMRRSSL